METNDDAARGPYPLNVAIGDAAATSSGGRPLKPTSSDEAPALWPLRRSGCRTPLRRAGPKLLRAPAGTPPQ
eukprot:10969485-Lingulodinium_polyedra.AAC.1